MNGTRDGHLIGGNELRQLVKVVSDAPQTKDDRMYIYPCRKNLGDEEDIYEAELLGKALGCLLNDFKEKENDVDRFVSIRIHVSRIVWRQKSDANILQKYFHLDHLVKEMWVTGRFNDSEDDALILKSGDFVVLPSLEEIKLPSNVYGFLQTRTTVALKGLDVTPTNIIVPGFSGCLYLQVKNNSQISIRIPDFYPIAELFLFATTGSYSGAGPEYQKTTKLAPPLASENTPKKEMSEVSVFRSIKAIVIYLMAILPIIAIAYYLLSAFPSIPKDTLASSLVWFFVICSLGFVVISFGKDIVSFITGKIDERRK